VAFLSAGTPGGTRRPVMGLLFYIFTLFVLMCIFGWSVRGTTGE
jgi:hypothetical protein